MRKIKIKITVVVLLAVFLPAVFAGGLHAAAKEKKAAASKAKKVEQATVNIAGVKAWNCAGCHKSRKILPEAHVDVKEMPYEGCLVCHLTGSGMAQTLKTKVPGSHLHALRGVTCEQCHGKVKKPEPLEMAKCVACHGETAKLAGKTAKVKPHNPHESPHYGTDADCNLCHHQHAKSENFCAQCHKFEYLVP